MTETQIQPASTPESGMWAPYVPPEIGEPLSMLEEVGPFVLLAGTVRDKVQTQYGETKAFDLTVATTAQGEVRTVSGFGKAIVGQLERMQAGDLPAVCKAIKTDTGRENQARELQLLQLLQAGADVAAVARSLPTPIGPLVKHANGNGQPAGHDGIPL